MQIRVLRSNPASCSTHYETLLDQKGFKYVFYCAPLLAYGCGQAFDPNRPAIKFFDDRLQEAPIQCIQAVRIHTKHVHGACRDRTGNDAIAFHLRKITNAT